MGSFLSYEFWNHFREAKFLLQNKNALKESAKKQTFFYLLLLPFQLKKLVLAFMTLILFYVIVLSSLSPFSIQNQCNSTVNEDYLDVIMEL